ncbi:hypothetical protein GSI_05941 [Ganoderma sinense ZZ0214-1]|uniref:Uncharacterized protein n=1 Tax=Ganoderma sinense ZZ0214-1 TaxID=1077348 RepID=A0A2G8SBX5_9APHY|nr:hypothetical protein GSI_05941 [Ganoderma sinense ZZ0214-1]
MLPPYLRCVLRHRLLKYCCLVPLLSLHFGFRLSRHLTTTTVTHFWTLDTNERDTTIAFRLYALIDDTDTSCNLCAHAFLYFCSIISLSFAVRHAFIITTRHS